MLELVLVLMLLLVLVLVRVLVLVQALDLARLVRKLLTCDHGAHHRLGSGGRAHDIAELVVDVVVVTVNARLLVLLALLEGATSAGALREPAALLAVNALVVGWCWWRYHGRHVGT